MEHAFGLPMAADDKTAILEAYYGALSIDEEDGSKRTLCGRSAYTGRNAGIYAGRQKIYHLKSNL